MEIMSILDNNKFADIIKPGVKSILLENTEENTEISPERSWESQNPNSMCCSYCRVGFQDVATQREHYKLDWHRFNLKQSLQGKLPISEQEFAERNEKDDISSISGSDSEKEETLDTFATAQGKIFLQNERGQIFSLYKCLLFSKKDEIDEKILLERLDEYGRNKIQFTILMLGGGHFAGAVFKAGETILHKTLHYYTVRQGQGGSQSSKDNKSGGSNSKSAGSSLRRYNEQTFAQHVQDILEQWESEISNSYLIFYRAVGPYNKSILFGSNKPVLKKSTQYMRPIPFSTRRATFAEVQRVHNVLTTVQSFGTLDIVVKHLDKHRLQNRDTKRNKTRSPHINRAKSRETVERPLPTKHSSETNSIVSLSENEEDNENVPLNSSDQQISFEHLQEFGGTEKPEKKSSKKKKPKKSKLKKLLEQETERKNEIIKILCMGNILKLKELFENVGNDVQENELDIRKELRNNFMNEILDEDGNSLMHIAAMNEHTELVQFLLENDSDPCLRNKKLQTPYSSTCSKEVRELMREFAREYPDKYNYNKAQIPMNTAPPEELAEKRKAQRKIKREKEKLKKEESKIKRQEEIEKERFLKLSDREKRALAAERRILSQDGKIITRCFLCACDISGKVPFEYLNNRFCSMECLKAHRFYNPPTLS